MIGLNELAATILIENFKNNRVGPEKGLRLSLRGKKPMLKIDSYGDNDHVITHHGVIALIVDKQVEAKIGDAFIDIEGDPNDPYISIRPSILYNDE